MRDTCLFLDLYVAGDGDLVATLILMVLGDCNVIPTLIV